MEKAQEIEQLRAQFMQHSAIYKDHNAGHVTRRDALQAVDNVLDRYNAVLQQSVVVEAIRSLK